MAADYVWLDPDGVITLNQRIIESSEDKGENHNVLDYGKLEGALGRPPNQQYYEGMDDVLDLAVAYMVAVGQAHAFENGNKRTAFAAGVTFLRANGYDIDPKFDREYLAMLLEKVILNDAKPETYADALHGYLFEYDPELDEAIKELEEHLAVEALFRPTND